MYLTEMGMQVMEWRITAPSVAKKYDSKKILPFYNHDLFNRYIQYNIVTDTKTPEPVFSFETKQKLTWTGNKVDLVELIYACETTGCFNHGHATLKEIVRYLEYVFNIDLGDYYHTFLEIRNRTKRTAFLDRLIKILIARMDEADKKNDLSLYVKSKKP